MSVKIRLKKLEDSQKADEVSCEVRMERTRQARKWIDATIEHINERARLVAEGLIIQGPPKPIRPLRANSTHTDIWLHNILIEAREKGQRELDATYHAIGTNTEIGA
jgi:hypothetical protein